MAWLPEYEALQHSTLLACHAAIATRGMDGCKEPRVFLVLALLLLGPGKQTTAIPQGVKCTVFNEDYMTCEWDRSQKPAANYYLYYWYANGPMVECEHYLQSDEVNTGCWFNSSQINLYISFNVYVNTSNRGSSRNVISRTLQLQDLVIPDPPINLSIQSLGNNQLQLTWDSTYKAPLCLKHRVEYQSNTDPKFKETEMEEMKFILPSVDPEKVYTFYVRSKINSKCGTTKDWSEPAGPFYWGRNITSKGDEVKSMWFWMQNALVPIGSVLFLILLLFTLLRTERVWLVLMPRIPNPSNKFEELFTAYQGNFSEWAGVPKDAVERSKPSYRESICHVTELLPGGGYLPLSNEILGKAGEVPGVSVDPLPKTNIEKSLQD